MKHVILSQKIVSYFLAQNNVFHTAEYQSGGVVLSFVLSFVNFYLDIKASMLQALLSMITFLLI